MRRPAGTVRCGAEYLGGARVRYTWPCGHTKVETLTVPAPGRRRAPMNTGIARGLIRSWERSGVNMRRCSRCAP